MKWIRNLVKKHDAYLILHEFSIESDNEMDSEHCKKTTTIIQFCMNSASGVTMKWIRNIAKNIILNSILHECSLGSDNEMDSEHGKKHDCRVLLHESRLGNDNMFILRIH